MRTYSLGMKQRLGIALALARQPSYSSSRRPPAAGPAARYRKCAGCWSALGEGVRHGLQPPARRNRPHGVHARPPVRPGRLVFRARAPSSWSARCRTTCSSPPPTPQAVLALRSWPGSYRHRHSRRRRPALASLGTVPSPVSATGPTLTPQGVRIPGMSRGGRRAHQPSGRGTGTAQAQSLEDVFMDLTGRGGVLC